MRHNLIATLLLAIAMQLSISCSSHKEKPSGTAVSDTAEGQASKTGSLYDIPATFNDQNGQTIEWQSLHGKTRVMAMVFTHCTAACPIITQQIKSAEVRITAAGIHDVTYTLISFDSKRDTAGRLKEFIAEQHLDSNWQLLHGSANDVRTIAALLNVQYKEWPGGDFTHSDVTFVVDTAGHIVLRQEGIAPQNPQIVSNTVLKLLGKSSSKGLL